MLVIPAQLLWKLITLHILVVLACLLWILIAMVLLTSSLSPSRLSLSSTITRQVKLVSMVLRGERVRKELIGDLE